MDLMEALVGRRSIRNFEARPVPEAFIAQLVEAIRWAPSAGNLQARRFHVVTNPDLRAGLARAAGGQSCITRAPVAFVGCTDRAIETRYGARGSSLYAPQDVAAATQNLMLAAYALGLGSVWVGAFDEAEVARVLDLPANLRPVAIVPVGYPAERPQAPPRIQASEAVTYRP